MSRRPRHVPELSCAEIERTESASRYFESIDAFSDQQQHSESPANKLETVQTENP